GRYGRRHHILRRRGRGTGRYAIRLAGARRRAPGAGGKARRLLLRQGAGAGAGRLVCGVAGGARAGVLPAIRPDIEARAAGTGVEAGPHGVVAHGRAMPERTRVGGRGAELIWAGLAVGP